MRIAVLILAIIGSIGAGFLGSKWFTDLKDGEKKIEELNQQLERLGGGKNAGLEMVGKFSGDADFVAKYNRLVRATYSLCIGAVVGLVTGILIFAKVLPGPVGGILLILCAAIPAVFEPKSLVFSGLLVVAGLLAFAIKKSTAEPARRRYDDSRDDDRPNPFAE